jgi:hypothetical protein
MSPGGGAANLGIVLSQGPLPDLEASACLTRRRAPFTLARTALAGLHRIKTLLERLCTRLSSRFNSNFRPWSTNPGQICLS